MLPRVDAMLPLEIEIPGRGTLRLRHLVSDVNGTLAVDGELVTGVAERLARLSEQMVIHLLTADTYGKQTAIDAALGLTAHRIHGKNGARQKADFVRRLEGDVVAIGQGANDALMLREAALGICVLSAEGAATETLLAATVVVPNVLTALDLLLQPRRLVATLRQ